MESKSNWLLTWNIALLILLLVIHTQTKGWFWDPLIELPLFLFFFMGLVIQTPAAWVTILVVWAIKELKR